jgi:hypothetical protein
VIKNERKQISKKGKPSKCGEIFYGAFFFLHIKTSRGCTGM